MLSWAQGETNCGGCTDKIVTDLTAMGMECGSVQIASDRHAADAGPIPRHGKGFSSQSQLQCRLSFGVRTLSYASACINICVHVKDPVVHVTVRWIMETIKHPACTVHWVARLCRSWLSPGKSNPIFPWEESHWDNTVAKSQNVKKKKKKSSVSTH